MGNDLTKKYSKTTIAIHWLSFVGIMVLIFVGFYLSGLPKSAEKLTLYKVHAFIGFVILLLTLFRIFILIKRESPPPLETGSSFHNKLIHWIHIAFYVVVLLLCLSGIGTIALSEISVALQSGDVNSLPEELKVPPLIGHRILVKIFIALLIFHVGGVIGHYRKTKENTLKRII